MMNLDEFGIRRFRPLWRVQISAAQTSALRIWLLERLISLDCASGDVRWAIIALALRSFTAVWVFGQRQFALLVQKVAGPLGKGPCFVGDITHADSMVAAGGS